jgi:hypothetical protein
MTFTKDPSSDYKEHVFQLMSTTGSTISSSLGLVSYPIVRLSEILVNPIEVMKNIHENIVQLNKYSKKMNDETVTELESMIDTYPRLFEDFISLQKENIDDIDNVLQKLNSYADQYEMLDLQNTDEATIETYEEVLRDLRVYNDLRMKLQQLTQEMISSSNLDKVSYSVGSLKSAIEYNRLMKPIIGTIFDS